MEARSGYREGWRKARRRETQGGSGTFWEGFPNGYESHPRHPTRPRSGLWVLGVEAGWGKGSAGVRVPGQLSPEHL